MMWQVILYALAAGTALTLAGICVERIAVLRGWPRRHGWMLVMVVSIGYPLVAVLTQSSGVSLASAVLSLAPSSADTVPPAAGAPVPELPAGEARFEAPALADPSARTVAAPSLPKRWKPELPSDRSVLMVWLMISGASGCYLLLAALLLARRAASWPQVTVLGQRVVVSPSTGPALLGVLRPRIVVPRWFLDEPASTQALILAHERWHLEARDPLLLRAALLAVMAVPWNLPLWWQLRRLRLAIELDCDARVIRAGAEPVSYGEVLLAVTRRAGVSPLGAVAMSEPVSALELRIRTLVRAPARLAALQLTGAAVFAAAGAAVALALEAPALPERSQAEGQRPLIMTPHLGRLVADQSGSTLQAALEKYPEIVAGRDDDGTYVVMMVFNADGSLHHSDMRFSSREQAVLVSLELQEQVPPDSLGSHSFALGRGTPIPSGGFLRNEVRLVAGTLPEGYEESRSARRVQQAVERKHAGLFRASSQGVLYVVTVLMTDDGRIDRDNVEEIRREEIRARLPEKAEASRFKVLGLEPEQLGSIGMTYVSRWTGDPAPVSTQMGDTAVLMPGGEREMLLVLYAWPRRGGERGNPVARSASTQDSGQFLPYSRMLRRLIPDATSVAEESRRVADRALQAILETYPEILAGANRDGLYSAAVTLRPDGSVYRSGLRFAADHAQAGRDAQELREYLAVAQQVSADQWQKGERLPDGHALRNDLRYQFTVVPEGFDEARSQHVVREAVLAEHADLMLPADAGVLNRITVMMTDDGRIAREQVEFGRREEMMRGGGRPEDFDFSGLGISADEVGVYGMTLLNHMVGSPDPADFARAMQNRRELMVRFAWPRRPGEPVGGFPQPPAAGSAFDRAATEAMTEQRTQAIALARRHFPEVLADPASFGTVRPWVVLSHQGTVLRTGQASVPQDQPFLASVQLGPQMPGVTFGEVEVIGVPAAANRIVSVAYVWLAAGSGMP